MAIVRTSFDTTTNKDLLKGTLRKLHDDTVRAAVVEYPVVCNDLKTKDEYERDARMAGLRRPVEIAEGQNIPIQAPVMGTTKTYTQRQFATGFRMTFKMDFFNKYKLWEKFSKDLGKVMKEGKDAEIATMFNNFTSTSLTCGTGFDSLAIASAAHTGLVAGTTSDNYSNYLNASLSQSGFESARYYFAMLKDDMGYYAGSKPTHLVIEPTLWFRAKEFLGSDLKAGEMSNTTNVLPEMGLKLVEYHRLTSTTCWFVIAKNDKYDFNVFTALEPKMIFKDSEDDSLDKVGLSIQFFTYGWGMPKNIYVGRT
jgi:hypothetical protein